MNRKYSFLTSTRHGHLLNCLCLLNPGGQLLLRLPQHGHGPCLVQVEQVLEALPRAQEDHQANSRRVSGSITNTLKAVFINHQLPEVVNPQPLEIQ